MINASQIKEHMEVKGSDGKHVGTVLGAGERAPQSGIRRHGPRHRHRQWWMRSRMIRSGPVDMLRAWERSP